VCCKGGRKHFVCIGAGRHCQATGTAVRFRRSLFAEIGWLDVGFCVCELLFFVVVCWGLLCLRAEIQLRVASGSGCCVGWMWTSSNRYSSSVPQVVVCWWHVSQNDVGCVCLVIQRCPWTNL